jgi:thiamine transport system permease protein
MFNLPVASILTLLQMLFTIILTWLYRRLSGRPLPLLSTGDEDRRTEPKTVIERVVVVAGMSVLFLLIVAPIIALFARSFLVLEADRGFRGVVQTGLTLRYYIELFDDAQQSIFYVSPIRAVINSLLVAGTAASISCVIGLFTSYGLRMKGRMIRWLDQIFLLPLGASAVTLGLGLLLAYSRPPLLWSSSWLILPAVHALAALPFVIRSLQPALSAIPTQVIDGAAILGASPVNLIFSVELPIVRKALMTSFIFAFTISLGEFGATAFLTRPDFPTIPVAIFRYLSQPGGLNYGQALAMAVILLVICGSGIWLIERFRLPGLQKL